MLDDIGKMNRRIAFSVPLQGVNPNDGGQKLTWIVSSEIWASVNYQKVGTDERFFAGRDTAVTAVDFIIRYRQGIRPNFKVKYDGLYFDITGVLEDAEKKYITLETKQVEPGHDLALTTSDGRTWVDGSGNAIVVEMGSDSGQTDEINYKPPSTLVFTDSEGNTFSMI